MGSPNAISHFEGSGTRPSGPEQRERRGDREVRQPEQPGGGLRVADHRVDLLGAHDRARDDRLPGAQSRRDETAATEPLQRVPLAERLADALEALGEDAHQFALGEQPLGVLVAGQRGAELAGHRADDGHVEHQVGAEQPEAAAAPGGRRAGRRWSSARRSGRCRSGSRRRAPPPTSGTFSSPWLSTRNQRWNSGRRSGQERVVGQVGVEAELVGLVLPGRPAAEEVHERRPAGPPTRAGTSAGRTARRRPDGAG